MHNEAFLSSLMNCQQRTHSMFFVQSYIVCFLLPPPMTESSSVLTGRKKYFSERLFRRKSTFLEHGIRIGKMGLLFSEWPNGSSKECCCCCWFGDAINDGMLIDNPTNLCWLIILGFLLGFKGGFVMFCFVGVTTFGDVGCINSISLTDVEATISVSGQSSSSSSWWFGKVGEQLHIEVERIRSTNSPILALISKSGILWSGILLSSLGKETVFGVAVNIIRITRRESVHIGWMFAPWFSH